MELLQWHHDGLVPPDMMPDFNHSDPNSLGLENYTTWFDQKKNLIPVNITNCDLEEEMKTVRTWLSLTFDLLCL